jgi:hypothetical protein
MLFMKTHLNKKICIKHAGMIINEGEEWEWA